MHSTVANRQRILTLAYGYGIHSRIVLRIDVSQLHIGKAVLLTHCVSLFACIHSHTADIASEVVTQGNPVTERQGCTVEAHTFGGTFGYDCLFLRQSDNCVALITLISKLIFCIIVVKIDLCARTVVQHSLNQIGGGLSVITRQDFFSILTNRILLSSTCHFTGSCLQGNHISHLSSCQSNINNIVASGILLCKSDALSFAAANGHIDSSIFHICLYPKAHVQVITKH